MKTEEVLVKRVLRGYGHERALEGVKKININSLRKALNLSLIHISEPTRQVR